MSKIIKYEEIPNQKYINTDTIYQNGGYSDAVCVLMRVSNGGGFRPCFGKSYYVIHSNKKDVDYHAYNVEIIFTIIPVEILQRFFMCGYYLYRKNKSSL